MVSHLRHEIVGALKMFQELNVDGIEDKDKRLKVQSKNNIVIILTITILPKGIY